MSAKKVVVLDGCGLADRDLAAPLDALLDVLRQDGSQIEIFRLHEMKLAHCLGCFNCWIKTPGMCVENDAGRQIAKAVIQSDTTVFYTPVTFGGYSPDLKKMLDHFVQIISPYFLMDHGEVHHLERYQRRPRLLMVGVQRDPDGHEALIFRTLAGRNAINFRPPGYAAEVVVATDSAEKLRKCFEAMVNRSDALPFGDAVASLMPPVASGVAAGVDCPKRALLLIGSPKTNAVSTSSVLGSYLLERLGQRNWETEALTLRANLREPALLESVGRAGLIALVFPLYVDSLPYLVTKALTVIAAHLQATADPPPLSLVAVVNSGFPETRQNSLALAICQEFAMQSGIEWCGGLVLGGGGVIGEQPLGAPNRTGPPVQHVIQSLDLTAAALAEGRPVPAEAVKLMAKHPFPYVPFALWRWIYMRFGGKGFEQLAAKNGVSKEKMLDQPYTA
jgi:multimeric flavodoxin WrbA